MNCQPEDRVKYSYTSLIQCQFIIIKLQPANFCGTTQAHYL
jgi:hypothetical protein